MKKLQFLQNKKTKENLPEDIYKQASNWYYDMYQSQSVWLKRTLLALVIVTSLLFLSLLANLLLSPLKQKVPYLYSFNNATGEVTKLGELEPTKLSANWQMTRYFLTQYVVNRESYDNENIDYPYQITWAMSDDAVKKQYSKEVQTDNETSPYKIYGKDKYITINVLSINKLNPTTAEVKFEKILHERSSGATKNIHKESIIKWKYAQAETTQKMLDRNPLGFKVTYYQTSQVNLESTAN